MDNRFLGKACLLSRGEANLPSRCPASFALWKSFRNDLSHHSDDRPKTDRFEIGIGDRFHPGIATGFAVLIALLQAPHRFRTKRQLWAYSGLALETHTSADYGLPLRP